MKNREKYKNELMDTIKKDGKICRFVKNHGVAQMLGKDIKSFCGMWCVACGTALQLWLDEEYEEPPNPEVDWSKVPVDTMVQVRDDESDKWTLRYFRWFVRGHRTPFVTWADGATSKTAENCTEYWKYCELVEDKDYEE